MRTLLLATVLLIASSSIAAAQTSPLQPQLAGIDFLVGSWGSGTGKVAETGGTSSGTSTITAEAGGSVLLRRDHTQLFSADGKPAGAFDQIMMIYPDAGTLHAEYSDGEHLIHYTSATIVPGHSVTFTSAASPSAPTFRLTYEKTGADALAVTFEMAPPGQTTFHPIATGTLKRVP